MTVIVAISDGGGMLFNNRRLSRDAELIRDLSLLIGDGMLYIDSFSEKLFEESSTSILSVSEPLASAEKGDFVFLENSVIGEFINKVSRLVIYKWNRRYPFDLKLDISPENEGLRLTQSLDFRGKSHEKITREIWER